MIAYHTCSIDGIDDTTAAYIDDMYVDFDFAMETARKIRGCQTYITNAMYHDAVRSKTDEVTRALFALRDDTID